MVVGCLALNASYEPLTMVPLRRALRLLIDGKAEIVEADSDRRRAAQRRHFQNFRRVGSFRRSHPRTLSKQHQPRLGENVHAIVARHRVAADPDDDAGRTKLVDWGNAVTQLRIRYRTMGDAARCAADPRNVGVIDAHTMNEERLHLEHTKGFE